MLSVRFFSVLRRNGILNLTSYARSDFNFGNGCVYIIGNNYIWISLIVHVLCDTGKYQDPSLHFRIVADLTSAVTSCTRVTSGEVGATCESNKAW